MPAQIFVLILALGFGALAPARAARHAVERENATNLGGDSSNGAHTLPQRCGCHGARTALRRALAPGPIT